MPPHPRGNRRRQSATHTYLHNSLSTEANAESSLQDFPLLAPTLHLASLEFAREYSLFLHPIIANLQLMISTSNTPTTLPYTVEAAKELVHGLWQFLIQRYAGILRSDPSQPPPPEYSLHPTQDQLLDHLYPEVPDILNNPRQIRLPSHHNIYADGWDAEVTSGRAENPRVTFNDLLHIPRQRDDDLYDVD